MLLGSTNAEIYEYVDVVFYSNGSQDVNECKLYIDVDDLKEEFGNELLQVYIIYKNQKFSIPQLNKDVTFDLPVEGIDLSINISATKENTTTWKVIYTVINKYNIKVPVNISFPEGYSLKNASIVVPSKSYISVILYKNYTLNTLYFEDSNISYQIPSEIEVYYIPSIPISIEKSYRVLDIHNNSYEWIAKYSLYNNIDISLNANISLWAYVDGKYIDLGNISNIYLPPNSTYEVTRSIPSDSAPIFYIKGYIWNKTERGILILPALKVKDNYIIGTAKVKGQVFYYPPTLTPINEIFGIKIKKVSSEREVAILSLSAFVLNLIIIPLLPLCLPPHIVDNSYSLLNTCRSIGRIYIPDGVELGDLIPSNASIIRPNNHHLISLISKSFDIPINSAKALAIAIQHGGILKTIDRKTYEIALKLGIDVEYDL